MTTPPEKLTHGQPGEPSPKALGQEDLPGQDDVSGQDDVTGAEQPQATGGPQVILPSRRSSKLPMPLVAGVLPVEGEGLPSAGVGLRILGIDPGLNVTGYGVIEVSQTGPALVEAGVVRGRTKTSLSARVAEIFRGVTDVIRTLHPQVLSLEQIYSHYQRPKTAILMGHARGVVCLAGAQAGLPVVHYAASRIKKVLTGNGRAPKTQMQQTVRQQWDLPKVPEPHDVADALAIALCHYYMHPEWVALAGRA